MNAPGASPEVSVTRDVVTLNELFYVFFPDSQHIFYDILIHVLFDPISIKPTCQEISST